MDIPRRASAFSVSERASHSLSSSKDSWVNGCYSIKTLKTKFKITFAKFFEKFAIMYRKIRSSPCKGSVILLMNDEVCGCENSGSMQPDVIVVELLELI